MGSAVPTDPRSIAASIATAGMYNLVKGTAAAYTAADPMGSERAKDRAKQQQEESQRRQDAAASDQERKLREAPRKLDPLVSSQSARRLRAGLAANMKAGGLSAPTLAPAALTGKPLLGQ